MVFLAKSLAILLATLLSGCSLLDFMLTPAEMGLVEWRKTFIEAEKKSDQEELRRLVRENPHTAAFIQESLEH
ncbi:MAG: hypothetical protein HQM02_07305, partial [Magnetococcales bacterium]|nr:hypothetical protein [Magnetococcales bacterium]